MVVLDVVVVVVVLGVAFTTPERGGAPRGGRPPIGRPRDMKPPTAPTGGPISLSSHPPRSKSSSTTVDPVPVNVFGREVEHIAACKHTMMATKIT